MHYYGNDPVLIATPPQRGDDQSNSGSTSSLIAISLTIDTTSMADIEKLSLLAISGFHTPRNRLTNCAAPQLPVVIRAGDLTLEAVHANEKFNISIQRKIPPLTTNIPHGVLLSIPLYYLTSIFIFDHGLHGHSMRLRLISPNRAFKLSGGATVPPHNRYMLDEFGKPSMLYPCHLNDHFELLGILQGREVVLQIPADISMEALVEWAARLKDTAATKNTPIQVLFDNPETGRVSQLQDLPARLQPSPEAQHKRCPMIGTPSDTSESGIPTQLAAMSTNLKQARFNPYSKKGSKKAAKKGKGPKKPAKESDDEDEWEARNRLMRPNSPSRYYRPQYIPPDDPSRFYKPTTSEQEETVPPQLKEKRDMDEIQSTGVEEIKDGALSDASTIDETPQNHQVDGASCNGSGLVTDALAVVTAQ